MTAPAQGSIQKPPAPLVFEEETLGNYKATGAWIT
jgi:hypothetical protein